jgi:hypothetical protein
MGKLIVTVLGCRDLEAKDTFGSSDPYVKLACGGKKFQTKVVKNCLNPTFNEQFTFFVADPNCEQLRIEVYDSDTFSDDIIGSYTVSLAGLLRGIKADNWYLLQAPAKKGQVGLTLLAEDFGQLPTAPTAPPQKMPQAPPVQQQPVMMQQPGQPQVVVMQPPPQQPVYVQAPPPQQPVYVQAPQYAAPPPQGFPGYAPPPGFPMQAPAYQPGAPGYPQQGYPQPGYPAYPQQAPNPYPPQQPGYPASPPQQPGYPGYPPPQQQGYPAPQQQYGAYPPAPGQQGYANPFGGVGGVQYY